MGSEFDQHRGLGSFVFAGLLILGTALAGLRSRHASLRARRAGPARGGGGRAAAMGRRGRSRGAALRARGAALVVAAAPGEQDDGDRGEQAEHGSSIATGS